MSTTAAIAAASAANSAAASAQAAAAARKACEGYVRGYEHNTATVEQAQSYADCINRLHPSTLSPTDILIIKAVIIVVIVGGCIGGVFGWRDEETFFSAGFWSIVGASLAFCAVLILAGLALAIAFLVLR